MVKILFIGDIVGKIGRETLAHFLPILKREHDFDLIIANGENATHGRGLTKKHYEELVNLGIDVDVYKRQLLVRSNYQMMK